VLRSFGHGREALVIDEILPTDRHAQARPVDIGLEHA
jgi:hypothetical protein